MMEAMDLLTLIRAMYNSCLLYTSTIVYVNQAIFPALRERLDNGRDPAVPLVPAKLEAYRALACSGSTPVSAPRGVLVVERCV